MDASGRPGGLPPAAFRPAFGLRAALVQSTLAGKRPVHRMWRRRGLDLDERSRHHLLVCRDQARLTGYHTPSAGGASRGLAVLIHGWEGCQDSSYLYSTAARLHLEGYDVFRLNLRDHAGTHHLNREMFHSGRLGEVLDAVAQARALAPQGPLFVIGFSLGGNFALRVALHGGELGLAPALTMGVSPSINPRSTLRGIDDGPAVLRRYFLDKWRRTLAAKRAAWPEYDFSVYDRLGSFLEVTRQFVADHTGYADLADYFAQYTLTPAMLMAAPHPIAIITAQDDSVIPVADFDGLRPAGAVVGYDCTRHGGHCGFIADYRLRSWAEDRIVDYLAAARG